eukprot:GSMAST32.ASY1.ANO1.1484.1 assembled CDS
MYVFKIEFPIYFFSVRVSVPNEFICKIFFTTHMRSSMPNGSTALHVACANGRSAESELLVLHGANVMLRDKSQNTPINVAVNYGHAALASNLQDLCIKMNSNREEATLYVTRRLQQASRSVQVREIGLEFLGTLVDNICIEKCDDSNALKPTLDSAGSVLEKISPLGLFSGWVPPIEPVDEVIPILQQCTFASHTHSPSNASGNAVASSGMWRSSSKPSGRCFWGAFLGNPCVLTSVSFTWETKWLPQQIICEVSTGRKVWTPIRCITLQELKTKREEPFRLYMPRLEKNSRSTLKKFHSKAKNENVNISDAGRNVKESTEYQIVPTHLREPQTVTHFRIYFKGFAPDNIDGYYAIKYIELRRRPLPPSKSDILRHILSQHDHSLQKVPGENSADEFEKYDTETMSGATDFTTELSTMQQNNHGSITTLKSLRRWMSAFSTHLNSDIQDAALTCLSNLAIASGSFVTILRLLITLVEADSNSNSIIKEDKSGQSSKLKEHVGWAAKYYEKTNGVFKDSSARKFIGELGVYAEEQFRQLQIFEAAQRKRGANHSSSGLISSAKFDSKSLSHPGLILSENSTVVRCTTGSYCSVLFNIGFSSGSATWEMQLTEDTTSQCTCFGAATKPVTNHGYERSPDLWMYRAYNGQLYCRGVAHGRKCKRIYKDDIIKIQLDMEAGTMRYFVNDEDQGIAFTNMSDFGEVFPAVCFYGSSRSVKILKVEGSGAIPPVYLSSLKPIGVNVAPGTKLGLGGKMGHNYGASLAFSHIIAPKKNCSENSEDISIALAELLHGAVPPEMSEVEESKTSNTIVKNAVIKSNLGYSKTINTPTSNSSAHTSLSSQLERPESGTFVRASSLIRSSSPDGSLVTNLSFEGKTIPYAKDAPSSPIATIPQPQNNWEALVRINGNACETALSMLPSAGGTASVEYNLSRRFEEFHSKYALDDSAEKVLGGRVGLESGKLPIVFFEVWGDGELLWSNKNKISDTNVSRKAAATGEVVVPVVGVRTLKLCVRSPGCNRGALCVWVSPFVVQESMCSHWYRRVIGSIPMKLSHTSPNFENIKTSNITTNNTGETKRVIEKTKTPIAENISAEIRVANLVLVCLADMGNMCLRELRDYSFESSLPVENSSTKEFSPTSSENIPKFGWGLSSGLGLNSSSLPSLCKEVNNTENLGDESDIKLGRSELYKDSRRKREMKVKIESFARYQVEADLDLEVPFCIEVSSLAFGLQKKLLELLLPRAREGKEPYLTMCLSVLQLTKANLRRLIASGVDPAEVGIDVREEIILPTMTDTMGHTSLDQSDSPSDKLPNSTTRKNARPVTNNDFSETGEDTCLPVHKRRRWEPLENMEPTEDEAKARALANAAVVTATLAPTNLVLEERNAVNTSADVINHEKFSEENTKILNESVSKTIVHSTHSNITETVAANIEVTQQTSLMPPKPPEVAEISVKTSETLQEENLVCNDSEILENNSNHYHISNFEVAANNSERKRLSGLYQLLESLIQTSSENSIKNSKTKTDDATKVEYSNSSNSTVENRISKGQTKAIEASRKLRIASFGVLQFGAVLFHTTSKRLRLVMEHAALSEVLEIQIRWPSETANGLDNRYERFLLLLQLMCRRMKLKLAFCGEWVRLAYVIIEIPKHIDTLHFLNEEITKCFKLAKFHNWRFPEGTRQFPVTCEKFIDWNRRDRLVQCPGIGYLRLYRNSQICSDDKNINKMIEKNKRTTFSAVCTAIRNFAPWPVEEELSCLEGDRPSF